MSTGSGTRLGDGTDGARTARTKGAGGRLAGRLIILGVTGSIAAYKAVELLRLLQAEGADVAVQMTHSATAFVGPLTFGALTHRPVEHDVLALLPDARIGHVTLAATADAVVVAPATAHWLGAVAHGLAGDVVTATCLATAAPVVVAPAMDGGMYAHPATQENVARLRGFGYRIVVPEAGALASGQSGVGRLATLPAIVDAVVAAIAAGAVSAAGRVRGGLAGRHVVVTAGGTVEAIDPVRFLGNRSTGRMGAAIAEAALARGARVTVIAARLEMPPPAGAEVVRVESAAQMATALTALVGRFDALVMAAAVADFAPARPASEKLARSDGLTLDLVPTTDILATVARLVRGEPADGEGPRGPVEPRPVLVGFAAETGSLARAPEKLARKGIDLLVANDVAEAGSGFGTETNRVTVYARDGHPEGDAWPLLSKREVAERLLDLVAARLDSRADPRPDELPDARLDALPAPHTPPIAAPAVASAPLDVQETER